MPPIKYQQPGASPEIISADIQIPDDADLGTGTFITKLKPGEPTLSKVVTSLMLNPPSFQISLTVNPNREMPVLLGEADGSEPASRVVFLLPSLIDPTESHAIRIEFSGWRVTAALFDGTPLAKLL